MSSRGATTPGTSSGPPTFRRLVVALGASRAGLASLATWADLAVRMRADLAGLFVEDEELQRMAGLPFARVVAPGTVARAFDPQTCERLMRSAAAAARAAVETHARHRALPFSFATVRGVAASALAEHVAHDDLVVVESTSFGTAAWRMLRGCQGSVLYLRPESRRAVEVVVLARDVLDGADDVATVAVLTAAVQLAAASARALVLLLHDGDGTRRRRAEELLARHAPDVTARVRGPLDASEPVAATLRRMDGAIVVASPASLAELLDDGGIAGDPGCSVLLVQA